MTARIAVVVPAHNEGPNLEACLNSLASQAVPLRIMVSDNGSTDGTPETLRNLRTRFEFQFRRVEGLGPSEHLVDCGRWLLASGSEPFLALLAGDDRWGPQFLSSATAALDADEGLGMAFPTCAWVGGVTVQTLTPPHLGSRWSLARQAYAVAMPNQRELANQVYGLFRRDAFRELLDAWERVGDAFAADYAAVVRTIARFRSAPAPDAVVLRSLDEHQDLLFYSRLGIEQKAQPATLVGVGQRYARHNALTDRGISRAIAAAYGRSPALTAACVIPLRTPQWLIPIPRLVGRRRSEW